MKNRKLLLVCMITATVFAISACSKKAPEVNEQASAEGAEIAQVVNEYGSIDLADYKNYPVTVSKVVPADDEKAMEYLNQLLEQNPVYGEANGFVEEGDVANIDYVGKKDGVAFDGGTGAGYDLEIGSGSFIDGFEDGCIGMRAGETKDIPLTFPEEYWSEELAGQDVVFTVTVNSVKRKIHSEVNDAWVKEYTKGEYNTVKDYLVYVKDMLDKDAVITNEIDGGTQALDAIAEASDIKLNEEAVNNVYESQMAYYEQLISSYTGLSIEDYATQMGMTVEDLQGQIRETAELFAKEELVISAIAAEEGMSVNDDDYKYLEGVLGMKTDEIMTTYGDEAAAQYANRYKIMKFLYDNANVTEQDAE